MMSFSSSISVASYNVIAPPKPHIKLLPSLSCTKYGVNSKQNQGFKSYRAINTNQNGGFDVPQDSDADLKPELVPKHVALILDGHRRWARRNNVPLEESHNAGRLKLLEMARFFAGMGVKVFTILAYSDQDWMRPNEEQNKLMVLYEDITEVGFDMIHEHQLRVSVVGDLSVFSKSIRKKCKLAEVMTRENKGLHFIAAMNYGGRRDILEATKHVAAKVRDGEMSPAEINETSFEKELQTNCTEFPCPDLLIRTGSCNRISNFMLWQTAHTELHFVEKLFPDLKQEDFAQALASYQNGQRRRSSGN